MKKTSYWERLKQHNRFPDQGKIKISVEQLRVLVEDAHKAGSNEAVGLLDRLADLGKKVDGIIKH